MITMGSSKLLLIFSCCSLLLSFATITLSDDDVYFECRYAEEHKGNFTANSNFKANLNPIISYLSSVKDFNYGFHSLSSGDGPDKVYATALCRGDRSPDQCSSCLKYTVNKLLDRCPSGKEVVAWSEFCMVRYANRDIFAQLNSDPRTCVYNTAYASSPNDFNQALYNLLNKLSKEAATGGSLRKYAASNTMDATSQAIYAAVQCTPDLNEQDCSTCLDYAMSELQKCCAGRLGCRVLRPNCILRFETGQFYDASSIVPLPSTPPSSVQSPPPPTSSATEGGETSPVDPGSGGQGTKPPIFGPPRGEPDPSRCVRRGGIMICN